MTDLQLLDTFCDSCLEFISPQTFREIERRGLSWAVNYLPKNPAEAKTVVRARLAQTGRYIGDSEIEQVADVVFRMEALRERLQKINMANAHKTAPILAEMQELNEFLLNYYKPVKF